MGEWRQGYNRIVERYRQRLKGMPDTMWAAVLAEMRDELRQYVESQ